MTKVLIVDDQEPIRNLLMSYLSRFGFECQEASNGKEALGRIREGDFKLVISDLRMPEMDGFELISNISTSENPIPVIIMTGVNNLGREDLDFLQSRKAFMRIIKKPFDLKELKTEIESCLGL